MPVIPVRIVPTGLAIAPDVKLRFLGWALVVTRRISTLPRCRAVVPATPVRGRSHHGLDRAGVELTQADGAVALEDAPGHGLVTICRIRGLDRSWWSGGFFPVPSRGCF